jgi:leucyl aminopeptidase
MTYKQSKKLDLQNDMILPCRKDELVEIQSYLPVGNVDFDGSFATYQLVYGAEGNKIYLLGLGEEKHATQVENAFRKLAFETQKHWNTSIQVYAEKLDDEVLLKAVMGIEMAQYNIGAYKTEKIQDRKSTLTFVASRSIKKIIDEGLQTGKTINDIKALVDAPPNIKTPEFLGAWAKKSAKKWDYKCKVIKHKDLEKQGFKALLSVGRASVHPPVVIVTEYKAKANNTIDLALVGKGITFDSGGLSIKPSTNLHYMKSDMGGAAAVLGIIELVAKLKLNVNIVGVVASAENAVGSDSYRPGDVIGSYSGKTIEIIDTDAEGRLALADGISYVLKTYKPNQLIDLATLTGSVVRTLGNSAAGMFTNNQSMASSMSQAGSKVHERVWPLPLYEDFESDLHSDVADLRNFSGKPVAGAINAAKFLEAFTNGHENWLHLDIAGVAFGDSTYAKMKCASGYGVQLLTSYIKQLS